MFFRIERSGPPDGGPARANPSPGSAIWPMITAFHGGHGCVSPFPAISARPTKTLQPLREILHGRQICVNLPARAVPFGSVAFPRRVFHTALPVASPHSRQLGPTGCPFPLLSSRFSPVLSGGCGPSGAHAGQASRPALAPVRGPTTDPHADTLGSRPSHAASRQPLRGERFAPSEFPPIFGSCLHVHPPLRASDSALCSSARCLPNRPS